MLNIIGSCITYDVDLNKVSQDIRQAIYLELDVTKLDKSIITLSKNKIDDLHIPASAIDYSSEEFFEEDLDAMLLSLVGNYNYYFVFNENAEYNGLKGFTILNNRIDLCKPNTNDLYLDSVIKQNKAIKCIETTFYNSTGVETIIIGLTNLEYENIKNADYFTAKEFVESFFNHIKREAQ